MPKAKVKTKAKAKPKLLHDYVCDVCGKPATYNQQNWNHLYTIDKKGNFKETDDWEGNSNEYFCDECLTDNH